MDPSSRLRPVTAWFVSMDVPGAGDTVVLEPQMPPPPAFPWLPAGQPGLGPRGQRGAQPRGTYQLQRRRPAAGRAQARLCSQGLPRGHPELAWALRSQRGQAEWRTRGRPERTGREGEGCFCHGGLPGRCGGDPGGSLRHLCKRGRECARGVGGGGVTLRTPIWPGFAPVPEAKRQKSRLNAAAGLGPPSPGPTPCRSPAPARAAPPCPLSLLEQLCADPC